jgi:rhamnulokinase
MDMAKACIAIDIGASSGRLIQGILKDNRLYIKEIHRFSNNMIYENDNNYWNIDRIFDEIIEGLTKLTVEDNCIESIGIDTWAVDYVLLDDKDRRISPAYAYRDHRTDGTMEQLFKFIEPRVIYEKTGIQFQQFNTIYQLYEHVKADAQLPKKIDSFLLVPDYLNFLLCGEKVVEFTNATTTQLYSCTLNNWDKDLINIIGLEKKIFPRVVKPGTIIGTLTKDLQEKTSLGKTKIIAPATHDTGSAIVSVPADSENFTYISSGTWSLMGIESKLPICSDRARALNFTNEGGAFNTYRILKNIMGLWLIQEVQRLYNDKYSFADFVALAENSEPFKCLINPNDLRFLNPENMIGEIQQYCIETFQPMPETPGEISRCIYESLAFQYKEVLLQLGELQVKAIDKIYIIGGGAQNKFINQLCADFTNCEVYAGPVEATAIGNLIVQLICLEEIKSLEEARQIISKSFHIEKYTPQFNSQTEEGWSKFRRLLDAM